MFALFVLVPVLITLGWGLLLSVTAVYFIGRKKPRLGKNNLACFLGIALGTFIWIVLVTSIPVGETSAQSMEGFPAFLLCTFLLALTPVSALPALMLYGPGKK